MVDSVITQFSSKITNFLIATIAGINRTHSYGDTWVGMKRFFNIGSFSGILELRGLQHQGRFESWPNQVIYRKTKDCFLVASSQVSGYEEWIVGNERNLLKPLAIVWHFWTYKNPTESSNSSILTSKIPLQLKVCRFRFS